MARTGRPGFSAQEKATTWKLWRHGVSFSEIGRRLNKAPGSIFGVLKLHGGITPPSRAAKPISLGMEERELISRGLASGDSIRSIAKSLSRSPSTVSREVNRNGGVNKYRAIKAEEVSIQRRKRPKKHKLEDKNLNRTVTNKLKLDWSPQQISGWLRVIYGNNEQMNISHESIYRALYIQSKGLFKCEILSHLRAQKKMRHSRNHSGKGREWSIVDGVSISERPASADDRAIPGHWEGDLISGSSNTHIATLVERKSRYTILVKVSGKDTNSVIEGILREVDQLPQSLWDSITWDRGGEMADHKRLKLEKDIDVYICDPQSPWQRGTNENTNGLLRQYLPKKTDLSTYTQTDLNRIAKNLNQRPRKTLGYKTPVDIICEVLR